MCIFFLPPSGLEANGDGDKKHQNESIAELQDPSLTVPLVDQTDMNPLALDHSEYESMQENTQIGKKQSPSQFNIVCLTFLLIRPPFPAHKPLNIHAKHLCHTRKWRKLRATRKTCV